MFSKLKIFFKSKIVFANFFLSEWLWKLRLSSIIFLIGKKSNLGKALNGLRTKGYYVFDGYYSNHEVEQIKENCHYQLNSIPSSYLSKYDCNDYIENLEIKEKDISIERMSGSIKLKKINQTGNYLNKISQNFFLLSLSIIQQFKLAKKALLIFSLSHDGSFKNEKVPGSVSEKNNIASAMHFDTYYHSLKAYVALEDIYQENGPFAYLEGSSTDNSLNKNYLGSARVNHDLKSDIHKPHEISENFKNKYKDKIFYGNQKKGDLVIMDTKGIHFASILKKGQRELLWFYY
ncbi:MAG: hypothetical protein CMA12_00180 [Euryarchaeota archaeon]|nr:hypothetical protein [Euryarchaeota archaeon]OUU12193.1 MAG: hypothetical protein CBB94_00550 [Gammaproteobacteria bacterium TMED34]|tara:strand:+ start:58 stop:927 length:870 start_codon:yes stop_codon:yes gene_type:complete